jgi:hypothetical protein
MKETTPQEWRGFAMMNEVNLPEAVFLDAGGRLVSEAQGIPAALIHRNFLFCPEPSYGIAYTKNQRSERGKLATLGKPQHCYDDPGGAFPYRIARGQRSQDSAKISVLFSCPPLG